MARTRYAPRRGPANVNFDLRRVAAAKENAKNERRVRARDIKIKKLLPQSKNVEVKKRGQIVRRMTVRRKTIFPPKEINHHREYWEKTVKTNKYTDDNFKYLYYK